MGVSGKEELQFAGKLEHERVAEYLESIADGIRQHVILVEAQNDSIGLDIGDDIDMKLDVKAHDGKSKILVEMTWRQPSGSEFHSKPFRVIPGSAEQRQEMKPEAVRPIMVAREPKAAAAPNGTSPASPPVHRTTERPAAARGQPHRQRAKVATRSSSRTATPGRRKARRSA